jgi:hypothetical protein
LAADRHGVAERKRAIATLGDIGGDIDAVGRVKNRGGRLARDVLELAVGGDKAHNKRRHASRPPPSTNRHQQFPTLAVDDDAVPPQQPLLSVAARS